MNDALEKLIAQALLFLPKLGASLLIFVGFWFSAEIFYKVIIRLGMKSNLNPDLTKLSARVSKLTLLVLGIVTALGTVGIDISALVAGLGLTGFAVGLALKDILSNLVAGILILLYKPFRRHEIISVEGFEGQVIDIDLRYTTIQAKGKKVLIPNSALFTNTICILEPEKEQIDFPEDETISKMKQE
ncbi:MAG: mechanosensitive ion channel [Oscillatoria sp. PMC 1051.18]|nr:mechanosensitive ion channel [Oscillatoria sp. PMC 1050.18]MEC5028710.1 mechanosensitive ion channel [Oscillatoria sp. PMC 1051.18]